MELWVLLLIIVGVVTAVGLIIDLIAKLRGKKINMEEIARNKKASRKKHKELYDQQNINHDDFKL